MHGLGLDAVVDLPCDRTQGDGADFLIDERVNLAGEVLTGTSHAESPFPPPPPWHDVDEHEHRSN